MLSEEPSDNIDYDFSNDLDSLDVSLLSSDYVKQMLNE